jgi:hypothetical protein
MAIFDIWEVSLDETPNSKTYMNFSRHYFCCFTVVPLFVLDKSMDWEKVSTTPLLQKFV